MVVTVPQPRNSRQPPLRPGDTFAAKLEDKKKIQVKVPEGAVPGQQIQVRVPECSQMLASTLTGPPPGCKVYLEHPIIVANVSHQIEGFSKELASSKKVTTLMQKAQRDLLKKASFAGCNAVLGINFNITTTSSTSSAGTTTTLAMVSAFGTPCIVASMLGPPPQSHQMQQRTSQEPSGASPDGPAGPASIPGVHGASLMTADLAESDRDTEEFMETEDNGSDGTPIAAVAVGGLSFGLGGNS